MILSLTLSVTDSALAYDVDTHFYGTYSMARFAGITHDVALKIATSAQWMDESYISDPVSMILAVQFGAKKRRLLHFPASRLAGDLTSNIASRLLTMGSDNQMAAFTKTQADDDFATEMFTEGLSEGNLMKAATGLHTLEDSFAHAGTFSEVGHAEFWHHPDRPYVNKESVEKYFAMTHSVFKALVAMRKLLPADKIDNEINFSNEPIPNSQREGSELADLYRSQKLVQETVSYNVLTDPKFVMKAVYYCFREANRVGYVKNGYYNQITFKEGETALEAISRNSGVLKKADLIDSQRVLEATGRPTDGDQEFVQSKGGGEELISQIVTGLIAGQVPRPLNEFNRVEREEDGYIWEAEMAIRIQRIQAMIRTMYNKDITFIDSHTRGLSGFLKEISGYKGPNPKIPKNSSGTEYVTFSPSEKSAFNKMIFKFLFPLVTKEYGDNLIAYKPYFLTTTAGIKTPQQVLARMTKTLSGDSPTLPELILEDLMNSRMRANKYNTYFRYSDLTTNLINRNIFKPFDFNLAFPELAGSAR